MFKTVVVTGANKGIGLEIARTIGQTPGHLCIMACRDQERGEQAAKTLKGQGCKVQFMQVDISSKESVENFAAEVKADFGTIDVLVNNAAINIKASAGIPFQKQARPILDVNYFGTAAVCDALGPIISEYGRIVNVSSQAGSISLFSPRDIHEEIWEFAVGGKPTLKNRLRADDLSREELDTLMRKFVDDVEGGTHLENGWPNTCYGVSKAGVIALSRVLARDLADRNIIVNSCCPGSCATDLSGNKGDRTAAQGADTPAWLALQDSESPEGAITGKFWHDRRVINWAAQRAGS